MLLITSEQRKLLLQQGRFNKFRREQEEFEIDFKPVVKLFVPNKPFIWLLSEIDPDDYDLVYGLCDTGIGQPTLRFVRLCELDLVRDIQRDETFAAIQSLGAYAEEARLHQRIIA